MFGTTATKPKEKKQYHVPSSYPFSALLVSVNRLLSCTRFPPFSPHTIRLCARVLSRTEPWLTWYCRESAIAWDHTLSLLSLYLKKKGWSQVTAAMPRLFQALWWWRRRNEMSAQKITGGRIGGESKGSSSLSSSLTLSSSFFFYPSLTSRCTPPPQRLEQATCLEGFIWVIQFYYPPKHRHRAVFK